MCLYVTITEVFSKCLSLIKCLALFIKIISIFQFHFAVFFSIHRKIGKQRGQCDGQSSLKSHQHISKTRAMNIDQWNRRKLYWAHVLSNIQMLSICLFPFKIGPHCPSASAINSFQENLAMVAVNSATEKKIRPLLLNGIFLYNFVKVRLYLRKKYQCQNHYFFPQEPNFFVVPAGKFCQELATLYICRQAGAAP
jgi:hypothetical protein